jgi:hypothetical protein
MPIEIVAVKTKDNGVTAEQVNRLERSLAKNRLTGADGFLSCRFNCLTDDPTGLNDYVKIRELERDDRVTNDKWYELKVFDLERTGIYEETKTVYLDAGMIGVELLHQIIFDGLPHRGHPEQSHSYRLSSEEMDFCDENNSAFIQMAPNWDSFSTNTYIEGFHAHGQRDFRGVWEDFLENAESIQAEYGDDVQRYLEDYVTNKQEFILPVQAGSVGRYFVNDEEKNRQLVNDFEDNVRPLFPKAWRGMGGDEDALYIHTDHEYRDLTRQTSFLKLEGESPDNPASSDRWLDLWIL